MHAQSQFLVASGDDYYAIDSVHIHPESDRICGEEYAKGMRGILKVSQCLRLVLRREYRAIHSRHLVTVRHVVREQCIDGAHSGVAVHKGAVKDDGLLDFVRGLHAEGNEE